MKSIIATALFGSAVLAGSALAQDRQTTPATGAHPQQIAAQPSAATMSASPSPAGGMTMADTATAKIRFVTAKPAEITSSKLVGKNLYNKQNETVGEIEDLVVENGKTIAGVVVSVGGFLGLGERYVLIDPSTIFLHRADGSLKAIVDADKDALKNAPDFKYNKTSST